MTIPDTRAFLGSAVVELVNNWAKKVEEGQKILLSYETSVKSVNVIVTFDLLNPEVDILGRDCLHEPTGQC